MTDHMTLVALDEIELDDVNPRKFIDPEKLSQLAASIVEHGVIQPVIVTLSPMGFRLIAGQRRYLAAREAGMTTIPAVVRDANGDARALSVVENLHREDLNPIEEAEAYRAAIHGGMTPGELAKAISVSEETIKGRLQLLKLPEPVQTRVADRTLPLNAAAALEKLAPAGEAIVVKAAELIATPTLDVDMRMAAIDVEDDPGWVIGRALGEVELDKTLETPFLAEARDVQRLNTLPWPKNVDSKALIAKSKRLPEYDKAGSYKRVRAAALEITTADLDAARAYGCLLEFGKTNGFGSDGPWITDPVWLSDRLDTKLDTAIAKHEKKAAPKKGADAAKAQTAETQRKDRERKERAAEKAKQLAARSRNITLGIQLYKELHAPKITADGMQLIAEVFLAYAAEDLGRRGLRYIDEQAQTVKTNKAGEMTGVTHEKQVTALAELTRARVAKAKTAEQIFGVLLQLIVAARYAEKEAAPQSDRAGAVRGLVDWSPKPSIVQLAAKIATPVLPSTADTGEVVE